MRFLIKKLINNKLCLSPYNHSFHNVNYLNSHLEKIYISSIFKTNIRCAGHSKWQNIRHTKAAKDNEKSKLFSKLGLSIAKAASKGSDPKYNKELSNLLDLARKSNVSREVIDRALNRAKEQKITQILRGVVGPNNIMGIIFLIFDPRFNKTNAILKPVISKYKNFKFVDPTIVKNYFTTKGFIFINKYDKNLKPIDFENIEEVGIESGIEEVFINDEKDKEIPVLQGNEEFFKFDENDEGKDDLIDTTYSWKLIVTPEDLNVVKSCIQKSFPDLVIKSSGIEYIARDPIELTEKENEVLGNLASDLNDLDEIEKIFFNVK